jgi:hypothetical protein
MTRPDETHGIVAVGEVPVVIRRDSRHEADHTAAFRGGRVSALEETTLFVRGLLESLPQYENPLMLQQMLVFLGDKIRETQA